MDKFERDIQRRKLEEEIDMLWEQLSALRQHLPEDDYRIRQIIRQIQECDAAYDRACDY